MTDNDPRAELDALESRLEAARKAVTEHLYSGVAVAYQGGETLGRADTPVDQAWHDRYQELKEEAERALAIANQAWATWVARRSRG